MTPKKTINIRNLKVKRIDKIYNVNSPYIKILSINNEYFFLIDRFPILKIEKTKLKISKAGLINCNIPLIYILEIKYKTKVKKIFFINLRKKEVLQLYPAP